MNRLTVLALRVLLVLLFLGGVLGQAWIILQIAAGMARTYPEVSFLELPYSVLAMGTVLCTQVVFVALWALLSKVRRGAIFTARSFRWVNAIIVAGIVATVLPLAVEIHLLAVVDAGPPAIVLLLTGVVVASAAFVLLMVVMRGLLHAATTLQDELAEVV